MEKIHAQCILEMLGKPAEHVGSSLKVLIENISKEKGVQIQDKQVHEPMPLKDNPALFTAFAELTLSFDTLGHYFGFIFGYFPANLSIDSPHQITLTNAQINEIGNALIQRLHEYDAIAKNIVAERDMFASKLKEIAPHLFVAKEQANQPSEKKKALEKEPNKTSAQSKRKNKKV
jgi:hypothetical protein